MPSLESTEMVTAPYPCSLAKERSQRSPGPPEHRTSATLGTQIRRHPCRPRHKAPPEPV